MPFLGKDIVDDDIPRPIFGFRDGRVPRIFRFICFQSLFLDMAFLAFCNMLRYIKFRPGKYVHYMEAIAAKHKVLLSDIGIEELREYNKYIRPLIRMGYVQGLTLDPPQVAISAEFDEFFFKYIKKEDLPVMPWDK